MTNTKKTDMTHANKYSSDDISLRAILEIDCEILFLQLLKETSGFNRETTFFTTNHHVSIVYLRHTHTHTHTHSRAL